MAKVSATVFKAQVATAAAALTTALSDTVKTEVAADFRSPHHPLRRIMKLFNFNAATGVVTSDDTYIDSAYAGVPLNKGNQFAKVTDIVLVLSTATVEDADANAIILTFDDIILGYENISVGGDADPAKSVSSVSVASNVVTVLVNTDYANGDTITLSGTFKGNKNNTLSLADQAVTNNLS